MRGRAHFLVLVLLYFGAGSSDAQEMSCNRWLNDITPQPVVLSGSPRDLTLPPTQGLLVPADGARCHSYILDTSAASVQETCTNKSLQLEFYRLDKLEDDSFVIDNKKADVFFLAALNQRPEVSVSEEAGLQLSPPSISQDSAPKPDAVYLDRAADNYQRPHHQILIANASAPVNGQQPKWYVTFADMSRGDNAGSVRYQFRATCLSEEELTCPRPLPDRKECSNPDDGAGALVRGVCQKGVEGQPLDASGTSGFLCKCSDGFGGYGCDKEVPHISTTVSGKGIFEQKGLEVVEEQWQYFQIEVPSPSTSSGSPNVQAFTPRLLVELERNPESSLGAAPLLAVKQIDAERYPGLPYYGDTQFYDNISYQLEQNLHYIVKSLNGSHTFYIGLTSRGPGSFTADLRVKWATPEHPFICPKDCGEHGTCVDPAQAKDKSTAFAFPPFIDPDSIGFLCSCETGWTGLHCEGQQLGMVVGSEASSELQPGQWNYHVLSLKGLPYDIETSTLLISWKIGGSPPSIWAEKKKTFSHKPVAPVTNAYLTINEDQFPHQADPDNKNALKQGQVWTYPELLPGPDNKPRGLQISGQSLKNESLYVFGVFNSDVERSEPFDYKLSVSDSNQKNGAGYPEQISIVIGVMAAAVLCLCLTLSRCMILRHSMFARLRARMGIPEYDPDAQNDQYDVDEMGRPRRKRGVSPETIATFPTFAFVPPVKPAPSVPPAPKPSSGSITERRARQEAAAQATTEAGFGHNLSRPQPANPSFLAHDRSLHRSREAGEGQRSIPNGVAAAAPAGTALGGGNDVQGEEEEEEDPTCTVCLCEYEEGELIKRLLPCNHEFHCACIDKWMTKHDTCPICRVPLEPNAEGNDTAQATDDGAAAQGQAPEREGQRPDEVAIHIPDAAGSGSEDQLQSSRNSRQQGLSLNDCGERQREYERESRQQQQDGAVLMQAGEQSMHNTEEQQQHRRQQRLEQTTVLTIPPAPLAQEHSDVQGIGLAAHQGEEQGAGSPPVRQDSNEAEDEAQELPVTTANSSPRITPMPPRSPPGAVEPSASSSSGSVTPSAAEPTLRTPPASP